MKSNTDRGRVHAVRLLAMKSILIEDTFSNLRGPATEGEPEPLETLAASMADHGLYHPIVVVDRGDETYGLRAGFRRFAAAHVLGWTEISAVVLERSTPEEECYWVNLVENQARSPLSSFALARAAVEMMTKYDVSGAEFARKTGVSVGHVNNVVRLYRGLPREILADWQLAHPLLTFRKLELYDAMLQRDAVDAWAKEKLGMGAPRLPRNPHPRATSRQLERLCTVVEHHPSLPEEGKRAALAVLLYAIGRVETAGITDKATQKKVLRRQRDGQGASRSAADISSGHRGSAREYEGMPAGEAPPRAPGAGAGQEPEAPWPTRRRPARRRSQKSEGT